MNDFLDQVWLDNTVRSYLLAGGIILFAFLAKKYLAHYVAAFIYLFIRQIWKEVDRKSFTQLVVRPLGMFLFILVLVIGLYKLRFPSVLDVDIYRITIKEMSHSIGAGIIVVSFIIFLLRIIDFIALILKTKADKTPDMTDNQLILFFKDFFKVILIVIGFLMLLRYAFGFDVSRLLTGLSIVGAALALAFRESLENLIASFIIFFDKPFRLGDSVKVQNFSGVVEQIGLRSTRIRTDQKTFITVPNKQMVDSILDNLSLRTQRRGDIKLEIGSSTRPDELQALLVGIRKILQRKEIEESDVYLHDITANASIILVNYFTSPVTMKEFNTIKEEVNLAILSLMESMGVEVAGAATDVRLTSTEKQ